MSERPNDVSHPPGDSEAAAKRYKDHLDNRLDEALTETFPASDPIAVTPRRKRPTQRKSRASQQRKRRS
jgi:hypothetical protein